MRNDSFHLKIHTNTVTGHYKKSTMRQGRSHAPKLPPARFTDCHPAGSVLGPIQGQQGRSTCCPCVLCAHLRHFDNDVTSAYLWSLRVRA